jgi:hypothetical protein
MYGATLYSNPPEGSALREAPLMIKVYRADPPLGSELYKDIDNLDSLLVVAVYKVALLETRNSIRRSFDLFWVNDHDVLSLAFTKLEEIVLGTND